MSNESELKLHDERGPLSELSKERMESDPKLLEEPALDPEFPNERMESLDSKLPGERVPHSEPSDECVELGPELLDKPTLGSDSPDKLTESDPELLEEPALDPEFPIERMESDPKLPEERVPGSELSDKRVVSDPEPPHEFALASVEPPTRLTESELKLLDECALNCKRSNGLTTVILLTLDKKGENTFHLDMYEVRKRMQEFSKILPETTSLTIVQCCQDVSSVGLPGFPQDMGKLRSLRIHNNQMLFPEHDEIWNRLMGAGKDDETWNHLVDELWGCKEDERLARLADAIRDCLAGEMPDERIRNGLWRRLVEKKQNLQEYIIPTNCRFPATLTELWLTRMPLHEHFRSIETLTKFSLDALHPPQPLDLDTLLTFLGEHPLLEDVKLWIGTASKMSAEGQGSVNLDRLKYLLVVCDVKEPLEYLVTRVRLPESAGLEVICPEKAVGLNEVLRWIRRQNGFSDMGMYKGFAIRLSGPYGSACGSICVSSIPNPEIASVLNGEFPFAKDIKTLHLISPRSKPVSMPQPLEPSAFPGLNTLIIEADPEPSDTLSKWFSSSESFSLKCLEIRDGIAKGFEDELERFASAKGMKKEITTYSYRLCLPDNDPPPPEVCAPEQGSVTEGGLKTSIVMVTDPDGSCEL